MAFEPISISKAVTVAGGTISYDGISEVITLDGGTATVTAGTASAIHVDGGGYVKVTGTSEFPVIFYDNQKDTDGHGGAAIYVESTGSSEISGTAFTDPADATVVFKANTYSTTSSSSRGGGAICVNQQKAEVNISNVLFENNYSNKYGGAVYIGNSSKVTLNGVVFKANTAGNHGGALCHAGGTLSLEDVTFTQNDAGTLNGGAIYVNGGEVKLSNVTFNANTAKNGGAIYIRGGTVTLAGTVTLKTLKDTIYVYTNGTLQVDASAFSGQDVYEVVTANGFDWLTNGSITFANSENYAYAKDKYGFAFTKHTDYISAALVTSENKRLVEMDGLTYFGPACDTLSGAIGSTYTTVVAQGVTAEREGQIKISGDKTLLGDDDVVIKGNTSTSNGGSVAVTGGTFTVKGVTFDSNTAATKGGGAIHVSGKDTVADISNVTFAGNSAVNGGAVYAGSGEVKLGNVTFNGNTATTAGGAVFVGGSGKVTINGLVTLMTENDTIRNNGIIQIDAGAFTGQNVYEVIKANGFDWLTNESITFADSKNYAVAEDKYGYAFTERTDYISAALITPDHVHSATLSDGTLYFGQACDTLSGAIGSTYTTVLVKDYMLTGGTQTKISEGKTVIIAGLVTLAAENDTIENSGAIQVAASEFTADADGICEVVKFAEGASNSSWLDGNSITFSGSDTYISATDKYGFAFTERTDYLSAALFTSENKRLVEMDGLKYFGPACDTLSGAIGSTYTTVVAQDVTAEREGQIKISGDKTLLGDGNVVIKGNTSTSNGGSVAVSGGTFTVKGVTFASNTTTTSNALAAGGGAIHNAGILQVEQVTFDSNTSTAAHGGAVVNTGVATLTGVVFRNNQAAENGGAINNRGTMTVKNAEFIGNTAAKGGAVNTAGTSVSMELSDVFFCGNSATDGGALYIDGSTVTVENATFATKLDTVHGAKKITFNGTNIVNADITGNIQANDSNFIFHDHSMFFDNGAYADYNTDAYFDNISVVGAIANGAASLTFKEAVVNGTRLTVNMNSGEVTGTVSIEADLANLTETVTVATNFADAKDRQTYTVTDGTNQGTVFWTLADKGYANVNGTDYVVSIAGGNLTLAKASTTIVAAGSDYDGVKTALKGDADSVTINTIDGKINSLFGGGKAVTIAENATVEVSSTGKDANGNNFYGGGYNNANAAAGNVTVDSGAQMSFYSICGAGYYKQGTDVTSPVTGNSCITLNGSTVYATRILGGGQATYTDQHSASVSVNIISDSKVVMNGATFSIGEQFEEAGNAAVISGGWQAGGDADVTVTGNSAVEISGSTVTGFIGGGGFLLSPDSSLKQEGSASVTINGGSTINGHIFGGIVANTQATIKVEAATNTSKLGIAGTQATSILIDTNAGEIAINNGNIYAGSFGRGEVNGNTTVTFSGSNALTFSGKVSGASSGATGKDTVDTDGKLINNDFVAGTKNLVFDGFKGDFGASEIVFMDTVTFTNSAVNFTDTDINLADVTTWNFNLSGDGQGQTIAGENTVVFTEGDTININWTGGTSLPTEGVTVFTGNITDWEKATVTYTGTADNVELYASDNNTLKLGIVATA